MKHSEYLSSGENSIPTLQNEKTKQKRNKAKLRNLKYIHGLQHQVAQISGVANQSLC